MNRKVNVDPEPICVQDDNFYTSAGVTAGIDLSLALLEEDHGAALALEVARVLVVFLRRPGNQAQFSVSLGRQSIERNPLRELRVWMAEHLTADLSVPAMAQRVAMSPRNFQRVFTNEAGKSAARYVEELRIETARRSWNARHKAWMRSPTVAVLAAPMFLPALSLVFCSRRRANIATGSVPRASENSMA
jgi:transcriptional regulator GlxA family with amidase domain